MHKDYTSMEAMVRSFGDLGVKCEVCEKLDPYGHDFPEHQVNLENLLKQFPQKQCKLEKVTCDMKTALKQHWNTWRNLEKVSDFFTEKL